MLLEPQLLTASIMVSEESLCEKLVGVVLTDDRTQEKHLIDRTEEKNIVLGVVMLRQINGINAEELRRLMCAQIASLPPCFTLLTKDGWPVQKRQENIIKASHIINENFTIMIKRQFEQPRVGIISTDGDYLGFIFVQHHWSLHKVREAIEEQLKDINNRLRKDYSFIERNGWPVALFQEHLLTVLDLLHDQYISIQNCDKSNREYLHHTHSFHVGSLNNIPALPSPTSPMNLALPSPTNPTSCDITDGKTTIPQKYELPITKMQKNTLVAKPILISYVRAEAVNYALDLKKELSNLGFSVYLDVHEIKTGSDWQDALNYAVSNCKVFVPLITSRYGKSRWTNREVKLADVLEKFIVPVNFLDHWPPECLAIQFASTQYISSKLADKTNDGKEKSQDSRVWDQACVKRVSKEIADRCKQMFKRSSILRKKKVVIPRLSSPSDDVRNKLPSVDSNKKLIVISAHPKQKFMCNQLKVLFEQEGYEVWCSIELQDFPDQVFSDTVDSSDPKTPKNLELAPIPEGESVFSQAYKDIEKSIEESKKSYASLKSDYDSIEKNQLINQAYKDSENSMDECKRTYMSKTDFDLVDKRQLTRLASMASDISQVSTLTSDKIEQLQKFQQKAKQAGVIIVIISDAYTQSKTSQQQVFYCERRKHIVAIKFDESPVPYWYSMLMGNDIITNINNPQFITTLKMKVNRALNPATEVAPEGAAVEAKMQYYVSFVQKTLPQLDTCVYIAGSSNLTNQKTKDICIAIGRELAKIENIIIVTGGCYGVQELVSKSFFEARENNKDPGYLSADSSVIHILPTKDSQNYTAKMHQNPDGTFEAMSFGKSIFVGDSVKERESAVARLFDTCIVIEGGKGAAREIGEFVWSDRFIIPIISTGGAAGGNFGVPIKILMAPPCVSENDWSVLSEKEASPDDVSKSVLNIILSVKKSIVLYSQSVDTTNKTRRRSRKSKKGRNKPETNNNFNSLPLTKSNSHQMDAEMNQVEEFISLKKFDKASRWQKFLHIFSATRTESS
ncbi:uncharacterized protein [Centruroides vittatus]|uniref:uncharacterized protein isoform X2 n=1 Tax=Centruroides vittatus TaxID=120091 RepID=UPI00350FD25A